MAKNVGRPKIIVDEKFCAKAESLAAQGLTKQQIALSLGIGVSTLCDKQNKHPEFLEAIKRGQAKGIATIANALFQTAKGGHVTAQIFYLKNRAPDEWKDRVENQVTGSDGGALQVQWMTADKADGKD